MAAASRLERALDGSVFVPRDREERLKGRKIVCILEQACLEVVVGKSGKHELLNGTKHASLLKKNGRETDDCRPDIVYQCLLQLLNSPLNKFGFLLVYIRTAERQLIEVSPQLSMPRTYRDFENMMVTFLLQHRIKAKEANATLLRLIKNDLNGLLPVGSPKIGLSLEGKLVDLNEYAKLCANFVVDNTRRGEYISQFSSLRQRDLKEIQKSIPIVIFIGAVAKAEPTSKKACDLIEQEIKISDHPLSAAACCSKLCDAFERLWCL